MTLVFVINHAVEFLNEKSLSELYTYYTDSQETEPILIPPSQ